MGSTTSKSDFGRYNGGASSFGSYVSASGGEGAFLDYLYTIQSTDYPAVYDMYAGAGGTPNGRSGTSAKAKSGATSSGGAGWALGFNGEQR